MIAGKAATSPSRSPRNPARRRERFPASLFENLRREIERLRKENEQLRRRADRDERKVAELEKDLLERDKKIIDRDQKIADLEHQLAGRKKDSSNSSKPPSSDGPAAGKRVHPQRKKSRRKPGGQPGHRGTHRALVPPERVDRVVVVAPEACEHCSASFPKHADPPQTRTARGGTR